jgi:hypothetical protein
MTGGRILSVGAAACRSSKRTSFTGDDLPMANLRIGMDYDEIRQMPI